MTISQLYKLFLESDSVATDTRNIPNKSIFFALKGANFNGNEFARQAIDSGAHCAIVDEKKYADESQNIFYVKDSLVALQKLAKFHRNNLNIPVIGLTGSNGKTTTKELIAAVLAKKYKVSATLGNLNNHIGVPLTILAIQATTEIAIVEMGANHQKEIEFLCKIAQPDFGYITNFGKAHLEGFGSEEGVVKAKSELYDYLKKNKKTAFVNVKDKKQMELTSGIRTITFGENPNVDILLQYGGSENGICPSVSFEATTIQSTLVGSYNVHNVASAIAIGLTFQVAIGQIKNAVENYRAANNRSQTLKLKNKEVILDAYNANPSSMEAALRNFSNIKGTKAVILGDMFELGEFSEYEHQKIEDLAIKLKFDKILLIGKNFSKVVLAENETNKSFLDVAEAQSYLQQNPITENYILIKGSRGMALEKIMDFVK